MPLSSVVGAQSIVKPGVCTSSTRPASPYDGQVIYETDTDRTLVYNGSAWVFLSTSRANPGGLDLIKTQTIGTAVTSVAVTDVFSSTYDNYKIIVSGGVGSVATSLAMVLTGSTASYYQILAYWSYAGTPSVATSNNVAAWGYVGETSTNATNMNIDVLCPNLAKFTHFSGSYMGTVAGTISGYHGVATAYTGFTLSANGNTLTGGTISVYGYAK